MLPTGEADSVFGIRALLRRINEAWLRGPRPDAESLLDDCFIDGVVFNGPGFVEVATGKRNCIAGYIEFANSAVIHEAILSDADVNCFGDTAIATYSWRLKYSVDGDTWKAAWRAMLPAMPA